ncbi:hypothetical protein, partial [Escherichia coli]|uniref:hypothetical protein n=1 Tax=Escherichia coli TaxID=562 RepID=UPI001A7E0C29
SGEYLPGSLQGKISSDGCLKKEQMVVSAIASTPHHIACHQRKENVIEKPAPQNNNPQHPISKPDD